MEALKETRRTGRLAGGRGFTLIELLITFAVIGVIILISLPNFLSMFNRYRLKLTAREIQTNLVLSRFKAISRNVNYGLDIDMANLTFQIWEDTDGDYTPDTGEPTVYPTPQRFKKDITLGRPGGGDTVSFDSAANCNCACFRPSGQLQVNTGDTPNAVYLTNNDGLFLRVRGNAVGAVKIEAYDSGSGTWQ